MEKKANGAWLRLYTDTPDCLKLRRLPESAQLTFLWYLCLWKRGDATEGVSDADVAWMLRLDETRVSADLYNLREAGLIKENGKPKGWDERQFVSDDTTSRVREWRQRRSGNVACNNSETLQPVTSNVTNRNSVTRTQRLARATETETDTEVVVKRASALPTTEPPPPPSKSWSREDYIAEAKLHGAADRETVRFAAVNEHGRFAPGAAWAAWETLRTPTERGGGAEAVARRQTRKKTSDAAVKGKLDSLRTLIRSVGSTSVRIDAWIADALIDLPASSGESFAKAARGVFLELAKEEGRG